MILEVQISPQVLHDAGTPSLINSAVKALTQTSR